MKYNDYNFHLAHSFVKHYNLPVVVENFPDNFFYEIDFYEELTGSRTKWNDMIDIINERYEGNPEYFIADYSRVRDEMLNHLKELPEYKKFDTDKELISEWSKAVIPPSVYKSIYNNETLGRRFIAVDMRQANFQVFHYTGIIKWKSYLDFLKTFTNRDMADYIAGGKYTRQAVFGNMNPKRQILLERKILSDLLYNFILPAWNGKVIFFGNDELVMELNPEDNPDDVLAAVTDALKDSPVEVRVEYFTMTGYNILVRHSDGTKHKIGEFYHKSCDNSGKFKCLPDTFGKIVHRLLNGEKVKTMDKLFVHTKMLVEIKDEILIEDINNGIFIEEVKGCQILLKLRKFFQKYLRGCKIFCTFAV